MGSDILRILHLEDNAQEAELVRQRLRGTGLRCEVDAVDSRVQFEQSLRNQPFDLVISDCSLPAFDGLTALRISRELSPHTPFVFYSGSVFSHPSYEVMKHMADGVVEKGDFDGLLRIIHAAIHSPQSDENDFPWRSVMESDACLKFLLNESQDGILAFDQEGIVKFWNNMMESIYGIDATDAVGSPLVDVLSRVVRTGDDLLLYDSFRGQPFVAREGSHIHPILNTRVMTETSYWPLRGKNDAHRGGIVVVRDRTQQRKEEAARRTMNARFQRLFLGAPEAQMVTNFDGTITAANDKACRVFELSREEIEGNSMDCLFVKEGEAVWRRIRDAVGTTGEIHVDEALSRRDGSTLTAELSVSSIGGNEFVVIIRDRSDVLALQEKLRVSEESFRSLGEMADDLILAVSPTGIVNFLNATFSKVTGWSPSLWLGRDIAPLIHPDDIRLFEYTARLVCSGSPGSTFRVRFRCTDGSYCTGECTTSPVLRTGGIAGTWHIIRLVPEPELAARDVLIPMN